ncbi:guanylate kinase [Clonorchis sinensis]|uniref:guanylate kinase n=1 Tax=Clonorchis sinensis TaxID=79923 RepID=A0A8T1MC44_CLOSI|nr:guanylate kinase [Clonorchis sinensis]
MIAQLRSSHPLRHATSWLSYFHISVRSMTKSVVLVFTGPSGVGKSTLLQMLMKKFPDRFAFSCSHTTRKMRVGEVDGRDYHFTTKEKMLQDIAAGKFWEHAEFAGNLYGTSVAAVEDVLATGRICILDVEMVGVRTIHSFQSPFNTKFILIRPPSIDSLEQRLRARNTETDETLRLRIQRAREDIEFAESPAGRSLFHKVVINDDLDTAYADLEEFLRPFIHQPTN